MENNEFKKVCIKTCTCYYFDDKIKLEDFYLGNILIEEKSRENNSIFHIPYKTLIDSKALRTRFDLITLKSGVPYIFSHCFAKIGF